MFFFPGPEAGPGHRGAAPAPDLDLAPVLQPREDMVHGPPPLRKAPLCSVVVKDYQDYDQSSTLSSSTSSLIGPLSKHSDTRLGEENKGHQLLMKMGVLLLPM